MFEPGGDEEGATTVLTPVGSVLGTLLLVALQAGLAGQLLGTSLTPVDTGAAGLHHLLAAPGGEVLVESLYVSLHPLLGVSREGADHTVEQLDCQPVLSPPPHTPQRLLVEETEGGTH